ncbi:single-stranded DNA-binding protein [Streptomyces sp. NPDC089424]|uniref:single-stranded DNA-binding protein n=1 Tax=Streptomyces sp. NPDC089424 TaxID=3365917 RepID=UPI003802EC6A
MAGEVIITVIGNLVDEVELRFTPNGAAVAKFRVASTPRKFNRDSNAWEDDKDNSLFLNCQVWRQAAEHCAESLAKGMRVIVQGRLRQRSYEDREGVKRTVFELDVEEIGPSLKMATAKVTKAGGSGQGRQQYEQARQQSSQEGIQDPWTSPPPAGPGAGAWGGDEPPF